MMMRMSWAPEFQSIALGEEEFSHQGSISTDPSHDLAHLLVGASGELPWAPVGNTTATRMAEYNAILLEHLLTNIYDCVATASWSENIVLTKTLSHAKWFVEHHYAPFPVSTEQALSEFLRLVDSEAIIRLAPHFFRQKKVERTDPKFREKVWNITVEVAVAPEIDDPIERRFVELVGQQISKLKELSLEAPRRADTDTSNNENPSREISFTDASAKQEAEESCAVFSAN